MQQIDGILDFLVTIEQLKGVQRKSRPVGLERYENAAEHSWHVCLLAMTLHHYANEPVQLDKVIKMLLLHDLGEIGVGDKIVYASEDEHHRKAEAEAFEKLLAPLPLRTATEMVELWREFEDGQTPEACFAKAIDRIPPLLHNLNDNGKGWKDNHISAAQVFELNKRYIDKGASALWQHMELKLQQAVMDGLLS